MYTSIEQNKSDRNTLEASQNSPINEIKIHLDFSISEFSFRKTVLPVFQKTSVGNREHLPLSRDHSPLSREHLPLTRRPKSVERPIEHLSTKVRALEKSDCASYTVWGYMHFYKS